MKKYESARQMIGRACEEVGLSVLGLDPYGPRHQSTLRIEGLATLRLGFSESYPTYFDGEECILCGMDVVEWDASRLRVLPKERYGARTSQYPEFFEKLAKLQEFMGCYEDRDQSQPLNAYWAGTGLPTLKEEKQLLLEEMGFCRISVSGNDWSENHERYNPYPWVQHWRSEVLAITLPLHPLFSPRITLHKPPRDLSWQGSHDMRTWLTSLRDHANTIEFLERAVFPDCLDLKWYF